MMKWRKPGWLGLQVALLVLLPMAAAAGSPKAEEAYGIFKSELQRLVEGKVISVTQQGQLLTQVGDLSAPFASIQWEDSNGVINKVTGYLAEQGVPAADRDRIALTAFRWLEYSQIDDEAPTGYTSGRNR